MGSSTYNSEDLSDYITNIFVGHGTPKHIAEAVSKHLINADLRGHSSHGIDRVPQYITKIDNGDVVPDAEPEIAKQSEATLLINANRGIGQHTTNFALTKAMTKAKTGGVTVSSIRHSSHVGRLGDYCETAASHGFVSIVTTGFVGLDLGWMMPPGGKRRFVGANPWAFGMPTRSSPAIYDASTTNVAQGKVKVAKSKDESIPHGWVVDQDGMDTHDPDDLYRGGALVPLGGEVAAHKGYGLGIFSALLSGLSMIGDSNPTPVASNLQLHGGANPERSNENLWMAGVTIIVIDPSHFGDETEYFREVDQIRRNAHVAMAQPDSIAFPGEYEDRTEAENPKKLIKIPRTLEAELRNLGGQIGLSFPAESSRV